MTTHELIELAVLNTLALLEDDEQEQFNRAFAAAPPSVQAHVRREQTRFSDIQALLPQVEPPADLRAKVVQAIRAAMAEAAAQAGLDHKINAAGHLTKLMIPSRRVSPLWRASALGFATAAGVMVVAVIQLQISFRNIDLMLRADQQMQNTINTIGPRHVDDILFDGRSGKHELVDADPTDNSFMHARVAVHFNDEWDNAQFYAVNFEPEDGVDYRLVVLDKNNRPTNESVAIQARFGRFVEEVSLEIDANTRLAVYAYAPGEKPEAIFIMV